MSLCNLVQFYIDQLEEEEDCCLAVLRPDYAQNKLCSYDLYDKARVHTVQTAKLEGQLKSLSADLL